MRILSLNVGVTIARATMIAALMAVITWDSPAIAGPRPDDKPTMSSLWGELEKGELESTRALLKMSARPDEAVAFLRTTMRPLKIEPQAAMDLIVKLESNDDAIWRPAFEELEYFDPRLAFKLEELMADINLTPARQRLVEVLSGMKAGSEGTKDIKLKWIEDQFIFRHEPFGNWGAAHTVDKVGTSEWWGLKKKWTRAVRAIMLLEHIGTPDAIAIIERMTTGHPDAFPTKAAKVAALNLKAQVQ